MLPEQYLEGIADYYDTSRVPSEPGAAAGFRDDLKRPLHWGESLRGRDADRFGWPPGS